MDFACLLPAGFVSCTDGMGMCASPRHGLVVVSDNSTMQLLFYSLADGSMRRIIGSRGKGAGQFDFRHGGLCVSPDGDSVLVAEHGNNRVQVVRILGTDATSFVRFVGKGVLKDPEFVDCNNDVIVVSEGSRRISVVSWAAGQLITRIGARREFGFCYGVRVLQGMKPSLMVASFWDQRLSVFSLPSGVVSAEVDISRHGTVFPVDLLECPHGVIFSNFYAHNLISLNREGVKVGAYGKSGSGYCEFAQPSALAALPDGGLVVRELSGNRCQVFRGLVLRSMWIAVCVLPSS